MYRSPLKYMLYWLHVIQVWSVKHPSSDPREDRTRCHLCQTTKLLPCPTAGFVWFDFSVSLYLLFRLIRASFCLSFFLSFLHDTFSLWFAKECAFSVIASKWYRDKLIITILMTIITMVVMMMMTTIIIILIKNYFIYNKLVKSKSVTWTYLYRNT